MRRAELDRQPCSLTRALSLVGDRWTLLLLRGCFRGLARFEDFQSSLGIARAVLAHRLQKLVEADVLVKEPYQQRPTRNEYRLTERGEGFFPVIMALSHWGDLYMSDESGPPVRTRHESCGAIFQPVVVCSNCGEQPHSRDVRYIPNEQAGVARE